jgi:hypothetical protein
MARRVEELAALLGVAGLLEVGDRAAGVLGDVARVRDGRVEPLLQVGKDQPGLAGTLLVAVDGLLRDGVAVQSCADALAEVDVLVRRLRQVEEQADRAPRREPVGG